MTIGLRRSRFLAAAILGTHAVALIVLLLPHWPLAVRLALGIGVIGSTIFAWRQRLPALEALRLKEDGGCEIRQRGGGAFLTASLCSVATVHPLLTVFRLRTDEGMAFTMVILPDSVPQEDFRRLRVWLCWRGKISGPDAAA